MLKLAFGSQARRVSEFPQTFDELVSAVQQLFGDRLISNWILTYRESSVPDIEMILDSEEEYENYRNNLPQYRGNPVIHIRLIEKTKSSLQKNQLEPVEEEPEFSSQLSIEEAPRAIDFHDVTRKLNSSQSDFGNILTERIIEKEDSRTRVVEPDFKEKVMSVLLEQLPLIVSHVKKSLEGKKVIEGQETHQAQCSGCQKFPIIGARYQCLVCLDFNFCEECEENKDHIHPFVKLRRKEQQNFLPQSLNGSFYSGKEGIMSINQIYRAGIQFPSSLDINDMNKMVTKRNNEEIKSQNELNFCNWKMETSQNTSQKPVYKSYGDNSVQTEKEVGQQERGLRESFGVFRGKRNRRRDFDEESSKSLNEEIFDVLKEIDGVKIRAGK